MLNKDVKFSGILIKSEKRYARCGDDKVAVGFKFLVNDVNVSLNKSIVVIVPCPDQFGPKGFFNDGSAYSLTASFDMSGASEYSIINSFAGEYLQTLWAIDILKFKPESN